MTTPLPLFLRFFVHVFQLTLCLLVDFQTLDHRSKFVQDQIKQEEVEGVYRGVKFILSPTSVSVTGLWGGGEGGGLQAQSPTITYPPTNNQYCASVWDGLL